MGTTVAVGPFGTSNGRVVRSMSVFHSRVGVRVEHRVLLGSAL